MADERKTLDDLNEVTDLQLTDTTLVKRPGGSTLKTTVKKIVDFAKTADQIHAATAKTTLVGSDEFGFADSADGFKLKKQTFTKLKEFFGLSALSDDVEDLELRAATLEQQNMRFKSANQA